MIKVKDHDDLVRDSVSGAILSVDKDSYYLFMAQHKARLNQEQRISNLESKLDKILELLEKK